MGSWSIETPPKWVKKDTCSATKKGWQNNRTKEVVVAIGNLHTKGGQANVSAVKFTAKTYARSANLTVKVVMNEKVDVTAGASIVVTWSGVAGNQTLYALAQTGVGEVVFNQVVALNAQSTVPNQAGTLSIGAQTLGGTIVDSNSAIQAVGTLTATVNPLNNETVVLNGKTYTFKDTLTNTDGFVQVGATLAESLSNLTEAVNLTASGVGTKFATATTLHPTMSAQQLPTGIKFTAKTAGVAGNSLTTTETLTNGSFGGGVLAGGADKVASAKAISAPIGTSAGTRVVA